MTQTRTAKTTNNAAAKLVVLAVFEDLFGPSRRPFTLRFWDGTVEDPKASSESRFTLVLRRSGALRRMLLPPTELALGEAYLHEDFDVEVNLEEATELADFFSTRLRLPALLARLVRRLRKLPSDDLPQNDGSKSPSRHLRGRRRSRKRDAAAVRSHYDVGNEFYALWLDRRMVYGLTDRCHIEVQDYRELPQRAVFDKVVSVGMFEHVGHAKLPTYFSQAYRLTRPGRLFLNHGIITSSSRSASLRVVEKARSWGEEYRALPFPRPHDGGGRRSAGISRPLPALRAQRPDRRGRRRREASVRGGALYQTLTM